MFFNELLAGIHLLQIQEIGLGNLWQKGFLEVNSMVKGMSRRENPCCGFIEHLGIVLILGRKRGFLGSGGLGK